jgi:TolB-like protein/class 3 adenylate cyclase/Tfp pilus assembly protein PilF
VSEERVERRLAAVLAADIAGYSRLMGRDEEGTLSELKAVRRALADPTIASHRGRIVKTTGDGMLVEFGSAVDAVRCAIEIQRGMAERNIDVPPAIRIELRIGVHVGDIIIDDDDIFGDGVNIAARLEGVSEPGGVCISDDAQRQVRGKIDTKFDDMGPQILKNIDEPMRAWRCRIEADLATVSTEPSRPLTLHDKPSIAVLPFQNMSGDPEQDYFADGMVEEIITALSRIRWIFVIARNSSFIYKGKAVDIKQVGSELGVRYVLEGSVRKAGNRLRIAGQLIDALTGAHIWADRFEGGVEDVFELQDQITTRVVGAIAPKLERAEIERSRSKPTGSLQAYDYYLRGSALIYKFSREGNEQALKHFEKAIELDPEYGSAYAQAANVYSQRKGGGWGLTHASDVAKAEALARRGLEQSKDDPIVLSSCGMALAFVAGHLEEGETYLKKCTDIDPNFAPGWFWGGLIQLYLGKQGGVEHFRKAISVAPLDGRISLAYAGLAYCELFAGRYDEASAWAEKMVRESPNYLIGHRILMVSHALGGRLVQAKKACSRAMEMDPTQRISDIRDRHPFRRDEDVATLAAGFRIAGMPE